MQIKKLFQYISIDRNLDLINRKSCLTFFYLIFQLNPKCFIWFRFLIYPKYIREILATFLCCSYCGLCEPLVRSLRNFPSHKLRVFKENNFLHLDDQSSCCHWSLKKTQAGVLVFWWRIQERRSLWIWSLHVVVSVSSTGG